MDNSQSSQQELAEQLPLSYLSQSQAGLSKRAPLAVLPEKMHKKSQGHSRIEDELAELKLDVSSQGDSSLEQTLYPRTPQRYRPRLSVSRPHDISDLEL